MQGLSTLQQQQQSPAGPIVGCDESSQAPSVIYTRRNTSAKHLFMQLYRQILCCFESFGLLYKQTKRPTSKPTDRETTQTDDICSFHGARSNIMQGVIRLISPLLPYNQILRWSFLPCVRAVNQKRGDMSYRVVSIVF